MISAKQLSYKLDLKLNNLASNQNQVINEEDKVFFLNEAQLKLVKKKIGPNNIYQLGFDAFKKRYEDLQVLIPPIEEVKLLTHKKDIYDYYQIDISQLKEHFMFLINVSAICTKEGCFNRPVTAQKIAKHADLDTLMGNSNYKPSFEYQETLVTIANNNINVYTDETFIIDYCYLSYIRYPKKIDIEGYINLDGIDSTTEDCELDDYLEDELLDLAVLEIAMSTENVPATQSTQLRIKDNE